MIQQTSIERIDKQIAETETKLEEVRHEKAMALLDGASIFKWQFLDIDELQNKLADLSLEKTELLRRKESLETNGCRERIDSLIQHGQDLRKKTDLIFESIERHREAVSKLVNELEKIIAAARETNDENRKLKAAWIQVFENDRIPETVAQEPNISRNVRAFAVNDDHIR